MYTPILILRHSFVTQEILVDEQNFLPELKFVMDLTF
jgi:hypothetical protein